MGVELLVSLLWVVSGHGDEERARDLAAASITEKSGSPSPRQPRDPTGARWANANRPDLL
jgi:hypothetical protein